MPSPNTNGDTVPYGALKIENAEENHHLENGLNWQFSTFIASGWRAGMLIPVATFR